MNYNCTAALQTRKSGAPTCTEICSLTSLGVLLWSSSQPFPHCATQEKPVCEESLKKNQKTNPGTLKLVGTLTLALLSVVRWTYTNCYTPGSGSQILGQILSH